MFYHKYASNLTKRVATRMSAPMEFLFILQCFSLDAQRLLLIFLHSAFLLSAYFLCVCVWCINLALKRFTVLCFQLALSLLEALCAAFSSERSSGTITYTVNTSCYPVDEMEVGGGGNTARCENTVNSLTTVQKKKKICILSEFLSYFAFVKLEVNNVHYNPCTFINIYCKLLI